MMNYKSITELKQLWDLCIQYYTPVHRKMKLLDATDRGDLWKALKAKFPPYQILTDTNFVSYIKNNLLASIYTVQKSASLMPTSEKDKELVINLNIFLEHFWDLQRIGYYQFLAGERAALLNIGATQVGWDDTLTGGPSNDLNRGSVVLKNISPLKFMRDPFAPDLDHAGYCITFDTYHKSVFLENPKYKDKFTEYAAKNKDKAPEQTPEWNSVPNKGAAKDYFMLATFWVKEDGKIHEIHTVNLEEILYIKEDIKPSMFPIADLYCNEPNGDLTGTSEPAKIFANNVAYNIMDSVALTSEYKNQRPPKFISSSSGLNVVSFAKHGDEADRTFIVNGDASRAVHYHQFPQISPALPNMKYSLENGIQLVSGIDGRYTGRDTGSIITTGGTESMLNRVTLIDTPKIMTYENYVMKLTKLVLANLIHFSPKREYFVKVPNSTQWKSIQVDFPSISNDTLFKYVINISSELPKNRQRLAEMANMLMEKQMQYQEQGNSIQLITEEEWLMFQDFPNKEYMLERMGIQRLTSATEEVSQVLFQYADLIRKGATPDDAILATAESLKQKRQGMMGNPGMMPMVANENMMPPNTEL